MIRLKIHASRMVKRTRYEAVQEEDRPNNFWVLKVAQSGKVEFLQPAKSLERIMMFFNKTIERVSNE